MIIITNPTTICVSAAKVQQIVEIICRFSRKIAIFAKNMMTEDGYGKGLAPAIFCCGAGTVRSDQLLCLQPEKLPMSAGHAQKKVSFW